MQFSLAPIHETDTVCSEMSQSPLPKLGHITKVVRKEERKKVGWWLKSLVVGLLGLSSDLECEELRLQYIIT